jgi:hypothetical protein
MQREAKKREEFLAAHEAHGPVRLGHRLSDQTTTTHSDNKGQNSKDNKGQNSKSSHRPGIEYFPSHSSAFALLDFSVPCVLLQHSVMNVNFIFSFIYLMCSLFLL